MSDDTASSDIAFAAGALIGAAAAQRSAAPAAADDGSMHVRRCLAHYRSYDPESDTYVGYDRERHYCEL